MCKKASARILWPGFLCLWVITAAPSAPAQPSSPRIASIELLGNHALSTNEILGLLGTHIGADFDSAALARDLEAVKQRYHAEGFLFAGIGTTMEEEAGDGLHLKVNIAEGLPAVLRSVNVTGLSVLSTDQFNAALNLTPGDPFVESGVELAIDRVLRAYEVRGYPTAIITVLDLDLSSGTQEHSVTLHLLVDEGMKAEIAEIRIEGNKNTKDHVILREVALGEDRLFTDARAASIRRSLERLQLFSSVSTPEFFVTEESKGAMLIRVREGDPNRFDGMIGYSPAGEGKAGFITGLADVQFRNLFGTGRRLSIHWMRESQATQELALRYFEPWVGSLPVNIEGGFFQRKQDSAYVRRTFDVTVTLTLAGNLTGGLTGSQTEILPSEPPVGSVVRSSQWSFGGTVLYDTRDDAVTPTEGLLYGTTYELGRKSVEGAGDGKTTRLTFDLEVFLPLTRRQVLAGSLHGRDFASPLVEQADLFRFGGASTLRGYRENQFQGSRIAWSNIEYRFLTGGRSFVYGFLDAGYIRLPEEGPFGPVESEFTRTGYGAGIRLDTAIGLMTVGLAFGKGDTFRTAKLHFRIINEF
ncbi:MAG TPA: POTRA domain-containing protein [Bacteroidota bacterium]